MRIGVFGGSFDPPHEAHLAIARAARDQLGLDQVLLVPARQNPAKGPQHAPARHRLRMCELLIEGEERLAISDIELTRSGPSYTVDTLEELHAWRVADYWLILGSDSAATLSSWKDPKRLVQLCRLAIALRDGVSEERVREALPEVARRRYDLLEIPRMDVSSRALRAWLESHFSRPAGLPERIFEYIQENALYGTAKTPPRR